jgi:hypothetical protein
MRDFSNSMLQVIYGKAVRRITLQRVLTGKIAHFPKDVTILDILVLFDNMLWLQEKALQDPEFREKFGIHLKVLSLILKEIKINRKTLKVAVAELSNSFLNGLEGFIIPKRNVKPVLIQLKRFYEVRFPRQPGIEKKKLPPAAYIGVGYRDKGTAKNPAYDGSPSWQEVASSIIKEL